MKKLICTLTIIVAALLFINAKTDYFTDLGDYVPALEERYPDIVQAVEEAADYTADFTDRLPTFGELVAIIKNEPLPIDPSDVAVNAYIENSPMLTFFPKENVSAKIKDGTHLRLFGVSNSDDKSHFIVNFASAADDELERISMSSDSEKEFDKLIKIPRTDEDELKIDIYAGERAYGNFASWVYNYLYIVRDENDMWQIKKSPVYEHNKKKYEEDRPISEALKDTPAIESDESEIMELAMRITMDDDTDYEKLTSIHDWVCSNIWYDTDKLNSTTTVPYSATKVLENKSAVCLGFSTLTAALCRSVDIPCNVVSGYALGITNDTEWSAETVDTAEQNHAWNEAYVDGRWVMLDTTWDTSNKIENGKRSDGEVSHLYFDANIDFFSANHKIIEYMRRP